MDTRKTLKILVGAPASGKSTYAEKMKKEGYVVVSSDSIRENEGIIDNNIVFQKMEKNTMDSLLSGKNVVYDATNMNRKKRMALVRTVKDKKVNVKIDCELFIVPMYELKNRNLSRKNNHGVTDSVIDRMIRNFETPWYGEGFDKINIHAEDFSDEKEKRVLGFSREEINNLTHDNPHHTETVGNHERLALDYIHQNIDSLPYFPILEKAAIFHDDGKYYTKTFKDSKGNETSIAHFYQHENVGAYLFLVRAFCLRQFNEIEDYVFFSNDFLYISTMINFHMRPLNAWKYSENARERDRGVLGEELYNDLLILNRADLQAK